MNYEIQWHYTQVFCWSLKAMETEEATDKAIIECF